MNLIQSVFVACLFVTLAVNAIPVSPPSTLVTRATSGRLPSTSDPSRTSNSQTDSSQPGTSGSGIRRCDTSNFTTEESRKRFWKSPRFDRFSPSNYAWQRLTTKEIWYASWGSQSQSEYRKKVETMIEMEQALAKTDDRDARIAGLKKVLGCLNHPDNARVEWATWQYLDTRPFINWASQEIDRVGKIIHSVPSSPRADVPESLSPAIIVYQSLKKDREAARDFLRRWTNGPRNPLLKPLFEDAEVESELETNGTVERWQAVGVGLAAKNSA
ncbi:hypothetical protein H0H93_002792 [Arthromyces matolae]|nr:hypothetical protein H0H93_002792 [Arthromyces matolae]